MRNIDIPKILNGVTILILIDGFLQLKTEKIKEVIETSSQSLF